LESKDRWTIWIWWNCISLLWIWWVWCI